MAWGEIARWNSDRGFGFVKSHYPAQDDVFIFGAILRRAGIEPIIGTFVEFETGVDNDGRPRVTSVKRLPTWRDVADTDDDCDDTND